MKKCCWLLAILITTIAVPLMASDVSSVTAPDVAPSWHARSLLQAVAYVLLFAAIGIAAAIIGFKAFDKCTPGDLQKEILENKNLAAAVVAAAVIVGVSIIIAAAMIG